jgi:carboxymethylenebutenolidase
MLAWSLSVLAVATLGVAAQDPVKERLDASPRHHEWVKVKRGERAIECFVAFPEVKDKAPAVLVIHENKGLTDWVRSVCDRLAEAGFVAIAPDLLSGAGPEGGRTDSFPSVDAATKALYTLDGAQVTADLDAVSEHALKLEACNGKLFVAGFCWGGSQTFAFAAHRPGLQAAFVFYGSAPEDKDELKTVGCPVYGFYGENDARINAGIPATEEAMKALGKTYEPKTYPGAGHGFMRAGEGPDATAPNREAREMAWARWLELMQGT